MPLPVAIGVSFAGGLIAGLVQFFMTKAGTILAGLALTIISVKSFESFLGFVVSDLTTIIQSLPSGGGGGGGGGSSYTALAIQVAAYVGLFDAVNIIISGYMAAGSLLGMKVVMGRLK